LRDSRHWSARYIRLCYRRFEKVCRAVNSSRVVDTDLGTTWGSRHNILGLRHFWWGREGRAAWVAPVAGGPLVSRVNSGSRFHRPWAPVPPPAPDLLRATAWVRSLTCSSWGLRVPQGLAERETSPGSGIHSPLHSSSVTGRCRLANVCGASMGRPRPEATPPGVGRALPRGHIAL
jgi:hypothetical protein